MEQLGGGTQVNQEGKCLTQTASGELVRLANSSEGSHTCVGKIRFQWDGTGQKTLPIFRKVQILSRFSHGNVKLDVMLH